VVIAERVAARFAARGSHYKVNPSWVKAEIKRLNSPAAQKQDRERHGGYAQHTYKVVPLSEINIPPIWHEGRAQKIREALRAGEALPPIQLSKHGSKWEVSDGIHRTNVSKEFGFTAVPAIITEWVETPTEEIPEPPEKPRLAVGTWVKLNKPERDKGKVHVYGYIEEDLGYRMTRGVRRFWYGVGLIREESTWPVTIDMSDLDFEPSSPPSWGPEVKARIEAQNPG